MFVCLWKDSNWAWSDPWLLNTDGNVNVSSSLVSEHIARWSGGNVHLFRFMFTRLVRFKHKNTKLGGVMTNKLSNIYSFIASNTENTLMSL